jgi:universal stress protein E
VQFEKVLMAIDFSTPSVEAASWITKHLAPSGELVLAHVVDVPKPPAFLRGSVAAHEERVETARLEAVEQLRVLAESLPGRVSTEVRIGLAAEALTALALEIGADLIAVGHHGRRRGVWSLLGGTAERVLNDSPIPVLLATRLPAGPPQTLLVPIDSSELTTAVLTAADDLMKRHGGRIIALHVFDPRLYGRVQLVSSPREGDAAGTEIRLGAEQWVEERIVAAGIDPERSSTRVCVGVPGFEILSAASRFGADFIIMGSRGEGGLQRALLGSVARAVLRGAPCPVLVLRG